MNMNFYQKGISVIELLISIAIIILLVVAVLPSFNSIRQDNILKSSARDVLSSLDKAHSQSISSINSSSYGVHFQSDKVLIFKGTSYVSNDVNNESISITSPVTISNISLGGVSDLYFSRLTGAPSASGTVTLSVTGNNSLSKTITISATGALSQN
jgi:Tfp pilus assembly protein FimT